MKARDALLVLIALVLAAAVIDGLYAMQGRWPPSVLNLVETFSFAVAAYVWFRLDSEQVGFRRRAAWSAGIVLFALGTVPLYLARSRPRGARMAAVGRYIVLMAGLIGLTIAVPMVMVAMAR